MDEDEWIRLFDEDGSEFWIRREEWAREILPDAFERAWNRPDDLYFVIADAIPDGFYAEAEGPARRLHAMDPDRERAAVLLSTVLLKLGDEEEAEQVLKEYMSDYGTTAAILTNLARAQAQREDELRALELVLAALRLDPNYEPALMWWGAIHLEAGDEEAFCEAMADMVDVPGSWRPQLWVARCRLQQGDVAGAVALYEELLKLEPLPDDVLFQMSGDLGTNGHPDLVVSLVGPRYTPSAGAARTGLNLTLACLHTDRLEQAADLLRRLKDLRRHDLREKIAELEAELEEKMRRWRPWWKLW